jgi:hypothetical protein
LATRCDRFQSKIPLTLRVDYQYTVFFGERSALRQRQDIQHGFRGAAQFDAPRRHDDRTVDQDWVGEHLVDELVVGPMRSAQAELGIRRSLFRAAKRAAGSPFAAEGFEVSLDLGASLDTR